MAELIASGITAANSADVTLDGTVAQSFYINYTGDSAGIAYDVKHKTAGGAYLTLFQLTPLNILEKGTFFCSGVFRFSRVPGGNASSLDQS